MQKAVSEQKDSNNDFSKGSVWRSILAQAGPMTLAQLIQVLYSVVDRMYIGHLPDASGMALTGIGLTFPVVSLVLAFTNLFGMGGAPLCSIARGRGREPEAEKIMGNTFILLVITGFFLMLSGYLFHKPVLYLFGASDVTYRYAWEYLSVYLLGTWFVTLGMGMNGFINAQGFAKTGMMTVMLGAGVNLILDPVFIFGFGMGVRGAALATVISQGLSALWVILFLTGKRTILKLRKVNFQVRFKIAREIMGLGLAGFIMSATNCLVQIVCNATLKRYGGDLYIGIMTILNSVREVVSMPVIGITNGAQPVLGYNYGAEEYRRVKSGIAFTSVVTIVYTAVVWGVLLIAPQLFIRLFSREQAMLDYGIPAMHLYFFGFVLMSLQFCGQTTFVALGRSRQAVFFSLLRKGVIVTPLTLLLPTVAGLGVNGVFLAEPISNAIGGTACFAVMYATVWKRLKDKEDKKRNNC